MVRETRAIARIACLGQHSQTHCGRNAPRAAAAAGPSRQHSTLKRSDGLAAPATGGLLAVRVCGWLVFPEGLPAVGADRFEGAVGVEDDLPAPTDE